MVPRCSNSEHYQVESRPKLEKEALGALETHNWPGNVRELENVIERAVVLSSGKSITLDTLVDNNRALQEIEGSEVASLSEVATKASREAETEAIKDALLKSKGNKSQASRELNVSYKTLLAKIKDYGI